MPAVSPRRQCAKCPWKVGTDPRQIPNGYCERKHERLSNTIATGSPAEQLSSNAQLRIMACHETHELPCVGWMHNQLGEGNNIVLRLAVSSGRIDGKFEVVGEQHACLEDTLPQEESC